METEGKKKIFIKNFSWSVASEIFLKLLSFIFLVVFSRKLGQTELGVFTYIFSIVAIVSMFWDVGIGSFYYRKWVTNDGDYKHDVKIISGARLLLIALSLVFLIPYIWYRETGQAVALFLVVAISVADLFKSVPTTYFLSKNRFDQTFYINLYDRLIYYGGAIISLLLGFGLRAVLLCFLASKIVSGIAGYRKKPSLFWPSFEWGPVWIAVKNGLPLFLIGILGSLYFRIDSIMIKFYLGYDWLGAYSAAYRLLDASSILTGLVGGSIFPVLVGMQSGSRQWLAEALTKNIKYVSVIGVFVTAVLLVMHDHVIIFLYGSQFLAARRVLPFLAPTVVFLYISYILGQQLIASRQEKTVVKVLIFLSLLNIGLNLWLIPIYGIFGAAVSTLVCEIANCLFLFYQVKLSVNWNWVPALLLAFIASVAMLIYLPFYWMTSSAVGGLLYLGLLILLKVINLRDFKFLTEK